MTDEELSMYIPKHGDRMALMQFCRTEASDDISTVVQRLREKTSQRKRKGYGGSGQVTPTRYSNLIGNKNAKKMLKAYQLCWHHFDGSRFRQVQDKKGGGVRYLKGSTNMTVSEMDQVAREMFFPNGISKRGSPIDCFDITMRDPTDHEVPNCTTLQELYECTKVRVVRLYMCTTFVCDFAYTSLHDPLAPLKTPVEPDFPIMSSRKCTRRPRIRTVRTALKLNTSSRHLHDSNASTCSSSSATTRINQPATMCEHASPDNEMEVTVPKHKDHTLRVRDKNTAVVGVITKQSGYIQEDFDVGPSTSTRKGGGPNTATNVGDIVDELIAQTLSESLDDTVQFGTFLEENVGTLPDTLMLTSTPTKSTDQLKLHRGHVFKELNEAMKNDLLSITEIGTQIQVQMILPNGKEERGDDSGGVLRDALSEYWTTFYKKCTTGTKLKVPVIRHDMRDMWGEVAKVMVFGLNSVGYFPIAMAKPFLESCLGMPTRDEEIVTNFFEMIQEYEKQLIDKKVEDIDFKSDDMKDFLEAHDVKTLMSIDNWKRVLTEIAHKEMIQEPAYVSDCWRNILQVYTRLPLGGLEELITSLSPKATKVISSLVFEDNLKSMEKSCAEYLKKFIRLSSEERLRKFLRFCTGSDILVCDAIFVRFATPSSDFTRTPVAHTCGCVLELPNTYTSAQEMVEEFDELLDQNIWVMDIV